MLDEYINSRIAQAYDYMQNDRQKALKIFDEVLEIEPNNIKALNGKGSSLMKLMRFDEADQYFNQSLSIEKNSSALLNKGLILKQRNDFENALIFYEKAQRANPRLKKITDILKSDITKANKKDNIPKINPKADEAIKKGIELKNENKLWDSLDSFKKAIEEDSSCQGPVNKLIDEIKRSIQNEFECPEEELNHESKIDRIKMQAQRALIKENNPKKTLTLMEIVLDLDETDVNALNRKGILQFILNDNQKAIECFDECLRIDENYEYALFNKALVLRIENQQPEALECLNSLLKITKHPNRVKSCQQEIQDKIKTTK